MQRIFQEYIFKYEGCFILSYPLPTVSHQLLYVVCSIKAHLTRGCFISSGNIIHTEHSSSKNIRNAPMWSFGPQVKNSTPDLMWQVLVKMQVHQKYWIKLPLGYMFKVDMKQMNFRFKLWSYSQDSSLCKCICSKIWK